MCGLGGGGEGSQGPRFGLNIREAGALLDPPPKASVHT